MICYDKQGVPFEVLKSQGRDIHLLKEMYADFSPKGRFQGLPPTDTENRGQWVEHVMKTGENFLAFRDPKVIGHALLLPDLRILDGEYIVFVSQHHRERGIGTALTRAALHRAKDLGLNLIWLTVDASNFIAIRLYKKFGFDFSDPRNVHGERKMTLSLES